MPCALPRPGQRPRSFEQLTIQRVRHLQLRAQRLVQLADELSGEQGRFHFVVLVYMEVDLLDDELYPCAQALHPVIEA